MMMTRSFYIDSESTQQEGRGGGMNDQIPAKKDQLEMKN
jgi:hypothetical protein